MVKSPLASSHPGLARYAALELMTARLRRPAVWGRARSPTSLWTRGVQQRSTATLVHAGRRGADVHGWVTCRSTYQSALASNYGSDGFAIVPAVAELSRTRSRRRLRRRWPGVSAGLSVSLGPPDVRRAALAAHTDQRDSHATQAGTAKGHPPRLRLSSSRPPRLGRSLRSRRMRSASPNLDPAPTHKGSAPTRKMGREQETRLIPGPAVPPRGFADQHGSRLTQELCP